MKTQRRRDRTDRLQVPRPGPSPVGGGVEYADGGASDDVDTGIVEPAPDTDDVVATSSTEDEVSANGNGNGHSQVALRTLPRRRRRSEAIAPAVAVSAAPPAPAVPGGGAPTRPVGTAATATTPVAPMTVARTAASSAWRLLVTYENAIWMALFLFTIITRFWDIGDRGIHHDESLHSVFSRNLYIGNGYVHDPMMHGPLQFHLIAFMFWLFGTSDATARFASAFCGIWVVMSPFFLRKQMGRVPALVASLLLFVSPSVLYFSRMAREDSIYSAMEMLMVVGLWRFISTRRPGDFFVMCAGLSLMFTIKETAYLSTAVFGIFFALLFAYQAGYAILGAFAGYGAAMGAWVLFINSRMKAGILPALPNIPVTSPNYETITGFVNDLIKHPLVWGSAFITVIFLTALVVLFTRKGRQIANEQVEYVSALPSRKVRIRPAGSGVSADGAPANGHVGSANGHTEVSAAAPAAVALEALDGRQDDEASEVWDPRRLDPKPGTLLAHYEPGSMPHLVGSLFARPMVLLIGFVIASAIFITLYTVFFTDVPRGIASGLFASLGYWMAQQGVARGDQPWYYYFILIPIYEPIAVLFTLAAGAFFTWKGLQSVSDSSRLAGRVLPYVGYVASFLALVVVALLLPVWVALGIAVVGLAFRLLTGRPLIPRPTPSEDEVDRRGLGAFNVDRPVPLASFNALLPAFLGWWVLGTWALYSWAGEKMPWLMEHLVRPMILFAALFVGALIVSLVKMRERRLADAGLVAVEATPGPEATVPLPPSAARRKGTARVAAPRILREQDPPWVAWNQPGSYFPVVSFLALFTLLVVGWGLTLDAKLSASDYANWGITWIFPLLILVLTVAYAVWLGAGRALRYMAAALLAVGLIYEVHSANYLVYNHPDVPTEMAVYVQTSPDVTRMMNEINDFSNTTTGGPNIKIIYDSFASWPFEWYLRDYKNKVFIGSGDPQPGPDVPVMILEYAKSNSQVLSDKVTGLQNQIQPLQDQIKSLQSQPKSADRDSQINQLNSQIQPLNDQLAKWQSMQNDYVAQRYAMRWWFPEDTYKSDFMPGIDWKTAPFLTQIGSAAHTIWSSVSVPENQADVWKYLVFRQPRKELGSEDLIMFVRKDVAQQFHYLQYAPPSSTDVPDQPAAAPQMDLETPPVVPDESQ